MSICTDCTPTSSKLLDSVASISSSEPDGNPCRSNSAVASSVVFSSSVHELILLSRQRRCTVWVCSSCGVTWTVCAALAPAPPSADTLTKAALKSKSVEPAPNARREAEPVVTLPMLVICTVTWASAWVVLSTAMPSTAGALPSVEKRLVAVFASAKVLSTDTSTSYSISSSNAVSS